MINDETPPQYLRGVSLQSDKNRLAATLVIGKMITCKFKSSKFDSERPGLKPL